MLNKEFTRIYLLPFLFFSLIALIVVFSWFRYGQVYGGGDVGLPSYDPNRTLEITKNIWWEASAPGTTIPHGLTSVPFQYFQSVLQSLGLPSFIIQAIVFWFLLLSSGYGMYLLSLTFLGKEKIFLSIMAGMFYVFNPYMMVQVWHRFIHNAFFLCAALPFFIMSFRAWLQTGKFFFLALFLIINFLAVYLYGTLAFIVTILFILFFMGFMEAVIPWRSFIILRTVFFRLVLGIVVWLAIHSWWLIPVTNVAPVVLSSQHSVVDNLSTLLSISSQTIVPYSLIGINPFYIYMQKDFGEIYNSPFFRIIPWLVLIFLVPGFIKALQNKRWAFWGILGLVGVFISKGATNPFGYPYIFGFTNFFPLGVLRNPFEKLGIIIPLSYAILFALGISWYLENNKGKLGVFYKLTVLIVIVLTLGVFLWPMWLGHIFGKYEKPAFIKVPDSYRILDDQINEQVKNNKNLGKILHLPLTTSESVTYNWAYGYNGVEPSQLLFKSLPSVSHGFNHGLVDDALTGLSYIFNSPDSKKEILALTQSFNIKYIVLHKDIEWRGGYLQEPDKLKSLLDNLDFLEKKSENGELVLYELKDQYFNPRIKFTNNASLFVPSQKNIYWPWLLSDSQDFLSPLEGNKSLLLNKTNQLIVSPEHVYQYKPEKIVRENLLGEMPAAKILPNSPLYPIIRLKEKLQYFRLPVYSKFTFQMTLMGKRLVEALSLKEKNSNNSISFLLQEYQQSLDEIKEGVKSRSNGNEPEGEISINFIMSRHLATLSLIKEKTNNSELPIVEGVISKLKGFMKETNVLPLSDIIEQELDQTSDRTISRFNLPISGKYEILQSRQNSEGIYPNKLSKNKFQINDKIMDLDGQIDDSFISYGYIDLPEGLNEISFNSIKSINLAEMIDDNTKGTYKNTGQEIALTSGQHNPNYIEINLDPVLGGNWYQLTFDSWIELGDKFKVQVHQDTDPFDPVESNKKVPAYDNDFVRNVYRNHWNDNLFKFYINPTTTKAVLRLMVVPWDGCRYYQVVKSLCLNKAFSYTYEQSSQVQFRNIKITRLLSNPLFLKTTLPAKQEESLSYIDFSQISPTFYQGKVNLSSPGFFIFNESYHPGWKLKLNNSYVNDPSKRFLANLYANSWYIEKPGEYIFSIKFEPEVNVGNGAIISIISFGLVIFLTIKQRISSK